jgi:hypothetical protein
VARTNEPLTSTDALDLAAALDVPAPWLRDGWPAAMIVTKPRQEEPGPR